MESEVANAALSHCRALGLGGAFGRGVSLGPFGPSGDPAETIASFPGRIAAIHTAGDGDGWKASSGADPNLEAPPGASLVP